MKKRAVFIILMLALGIVLARSGPGFAAESGIGHYMPGLTASFIDEALPRETPFVVENQFNYYNASSGLGQQLEFGGRVAANISSTSYAEVPLLAYTSPLSLLGGNFAFAAAIPYIWLDVNGQVTLKRTRPEDGTVVERTVAVSDSTNGIGDITLIPFWLAWSQGDLKWDLRLLVFAPTGEYNEGQLANVGLNYWTFTPMATASYLSSKYGYEITAFMGFDFNTNNNAIDYHSGDVFHYDMTIAQHLPLFDWGIIGAGANFFYWQQITGDTGSGARLGPFKSHTTGIGPVVSFITPKKNFIFEVKWLPDIQVADRLQGDQVWFKAAYVF
jgi:hypothetical protein